MEVLQLIVASLRLLALTCLCFWAMNLHVKQNVSPVSRMLIVRNTRNKIDFGCLILMSFLVLVYSQLWLLIFFLKIVSFVLYKFRRAANILTLTRD
ncbi:hypothetical protein VNO77_11074 [Canavalia gladiata]|uniref:Uncharacterized protein n=1 Tax=Canavalia gladiata TaxID=3824 RepID=A0AAN9MGG9_CANGL